MTHFFKCKIFFLSFVYFSLPVSIKFKFEAGANGNWYYSKTKKYKILNGSVKIGKITHDYFQESCNSLICSRNNKKDVREEQDTNAKTQKTHGWKKLGNILDATRTWEIFWLQLGHGKYLGCNQKSAYY